jgi:hypothetical protein
VFVATQSSWFFLCSRENFSLVENGLNTTPSKSTIHQLKIYLSINLKLLENKNTPEF